MTVPAKPEALTYISFGAGVQSTALLLASDRGLRGIERADVAIFADTGDEPAWVYETLERVKAAVSIPVEVVSAGILSARIIDRIEGRAKSAPMLPAFTVGQDGKAAPLGRNCTRDYKIFPIQRHVRKLIGKKETATAFIGISTDEAHRMKDAMVPWILNRFPLIEAGMSRTDCLRLISECNLPAPKRSACVYCPYHSNSYWLDLKRNHGREWKRAVEFDNKIRDMSAAGVRGKVYLSRQLVPLSEVDLNESQMEMFGNECEGMCGV